MRKLNQWMIFTLLLSLVACSDKVEDRFVIKGTIKNAFSDYIYLEEASLTNAQPLIVDSSRIGKDGEFQLSTIAAEENIYLLRLPGYPNPMATVVNDREAVTVNIDLENQKKPYTVRGSPASEKLSDFFYSSNEKLAAIYKMGKAADSLKTAGAVDTVVGAAINRRDMASIDYKNDVLQILNGSESPALSLFVLGSYQSYASSPALALSPFSQQQVTDMIQKLSERFPDHKGIAHLKKTFSAQALPEPLDNKGLVSKPAPAFSLPDVNGKEISLASFKGQYVLVDFWASWCRPCREENPNVVKAYQQFKGKNFTVFGVSLDKEKDPWLQAIKDDQLDWKHVSDLKFWDSMVVPLYSIQGIPYNVLVDPKGVIIAENLRGQQLIDKLQEVLK